MELPRSAAGGSSFIDGFFSSLPAASTGSDSNDPVILEVPRSTTKGLQKVVEYLTYNAQVPMQRIKDPTVYHLAPLYETIVPQEWYRNYVDNMDLPTFWKVRAMANFMGIEQLSLLLNVALTFKIFKRSPEEIGRLLNIPPMTNAQLQAAQEQEPWLLEFVRAMQNEGETES